MFLTKSEYDHGVNTFSPEGHLFQVEYAMEAIKLGSTGIGIQTKEGVVLVVEKRITSTLLVPSSIEKITEIDTHIGCCMSGLTADARTLIEHARNETQNHRFNYDEPMLVESCTQAVCDLALRFGEDGKKEDIMSRPFGVALLIAGIDERGAQLYHCDPSGTFVQYEAKAIGAASEGAQNSLKEHLLVESTDENGKPKFERKEISLAEAEELALRILKQVMEEEVKSTNIEIAVARTATKTFEIYKKDKIDALIEIVKKSSDSDNILSL